jgi:hypothetical protein
MVLHITGWRLGLVWAAAAFVGAVAYVLLLLICTRSKTAFEQTASLASRTFEFNLEESS